MWFEYNKHLYNLIHVREMYIVGEGSIKIALVYKCDHQKNDFDRHEIRCGSQEETIEVFEALKAILCVNLK